MLGLFTALTSVTLFLLYQCSLTYNAGTQAPGKTLPLVFPEILGGLLWASIRAVQFSSLLPLLQASQDSTMAIRHHRTCLALLALLLGNAVSSCHCSSPGAENTVVAADVAFFPLVCVYACVYNLPLPYPHCLFSPQATRKGINITQKWRH